VKKYLLNLFEQASEKLSYLKEIELQFNVPQEIEYGDFSTNAAMLLTKKLKKNPRIIAEEIISKLNINNDIITKVEIAGPGFINFYFTPNFVNKIIEEIIDQKEKYGFSNEFNGRKANVEFVSANPTGPLTVGHGRNAVLGDTLANLLEAVGYSVDREYYFNNAGRQMRVLGNSVASRYLELLGEKGEFKEEYYQGEYIKDIAKVIYDKYSDSLKNDFENVVFKNTAEQQIFDDIKKTLNSIDIEFNQFYNEDDLYKNGNIENLLKFFSDKNLSYEKEGAIWLKFSELGQEADKVIVKSTGEPTYRLPDIAYHKTKFDRGYDLMVDIFGSDHNATYTDVLAGIEALGYNKEKVKVIIHQFVTITQGGEVVKMSTRKANFITLDELVTEVGKDVVRYFFIMRNYSSHMNFDLDLAKKQSDENPVFYLKYAHARIASILRLTEEQGLKISIENLNLITNGIEQKLIKHLHLYKEELINAAINFEPHKLANYLQELASLFHKFYTECRIIGSEKNLAEARIALIVAVKNVLKNGLSILSIEAPESM
jgi:arginyl-tRNA synthetase